MQSAAAVAGASLLQMPSHSILSHQVLARGKEALTTACWCLSLLHLFLCGRGSRYFRNRWTSSSLTVSPSISTLMSVRSSLSLSVERISGCIHSECFPPCELLLPSSIILLMVLGLSGTCKSMFSITLILLLPLGFPQALFLWVFPTSAILKNPAHA